MLAPEQGQNETNIKTSAQRNRIRPTLLFAVFLLMGLVISIQGEDDKPQQTKNSEEDKAVTNKPAGRKSLKGKAGIRYIQHKLEEYVEKHQTDLGMDQIIEMSNNYASWSQEEKDAARSSPELRLVIDFALTPMQQNLIPVPELIFKKYKGFRNAYWHGGYVYQNTKKPVETVSLYKKLTSGAALVIEDFSKARDEALDQLKIMNKLSKDGLVYDDLRELEELVNFFNLNIFKPLFFYVFPKMKEMEEMEEMKKMEGMKEMEETKEMKEMKELKKMKDVSELKSLYLEKIRLFGYGKGWTKIAVKCTEPGFMSVF